MCFQLCRRLRGQPEPGHRPPLRRLRPHVPLRLVHAQPLQRRRAGKREMDTLQIFGPIYATLRDPMHFDAFDAV